MNTLHEQAKVTSPVAHVDTSGAIYGMVIGAAVGVGVTILTGGAGALAFIGGAALWAGRGQMVGLIVNPQELEVEGHLRDGSPDTFIGADIQKAARASFASPRTEADCDGGAYVVQGSDSVFINCCGASRVLDGTSCGGLVTDGDPTVFVGGVPSTIFEVGTLPMDDNLVFLARLNWVVGLTGLLKLPTTAFGGFMYVLGGVTTAESAIVGPENGPGPIGEATGWFGPAVGVFKVATGQQPATLKTAEQLWKLIEETEP